jgi:hypothetical protein
VWVVGWAQHGHDEDEDKAYGEDVGDVSVALCDALLAARGNSKSRYLAIGTISSERLRYEPRTYTRPLTHKFTLSHSFTHSLSHTLITRTHTHTHTHSKTHTHSHTHSHPHTRTHTYNSPHALQALDRPTACAFRRGLRVRTSCALGAVGNSLAPSRRVAARSIGVYGRQQTGPCGKPAQCL